jgi:hypothetical protein
VITGKDRVLVGANEDWWRLDAFMWATPASAQRHGVVYWGYEIDGEFGARPPFWYEFQGINAQGLYFDSFGTPCVTPTETLKRPYGGEHLMVEALESSATVEEAVAVFERYNLRFMACQQFLFVDRMGAAAVVEGDRVTVKASDQTTFVVTNFRLSAPAGGGYPCRRYETATQLLAHNAAPPCGA